MPKKICFYECENCGKRFDSETLAVMCEEGHAKPVSITKYEYITEKSNSNYPSTSGHEFPESILIKFDDGLERWYRFSSYK